jgi:hypothetical protein
VTAIANRRELLEEKLAAIQYQEQVVLKELEAIKQECRHPSRTPSVKSGRLACPDCGESGKS